MPREGECSTPRTPALTGGERSLGRAASLRRALPLPPSEHTRLIRGPSADSSLTVGSRSARGLPQLTTRLDRLDAGNGVYFGGYGPDVASVGGDAFSFYLLRFQAGLVISGPHKASGLRAPQAERAPWGFLRLCGPGWLSSTSAGAGGFLGSGAAWVTVRPRATRPRVSFRRPGQCRELSGAAKRGSRADEAPESYSCQVSVCPGKAAFPGVCAAVYLTQSSRVAPCILVLVSCISSGHAPLRGLPTRDILQYIKLKMSSFIEV